MHIQATTKSTALLAGRLSLKHKWIAEWYFFHRVRWQFGASICREDDPVLYVAIPWLLAIYIHLPPIFTLHQPWRFGFDVHDGSLWLHTFSSVMDWRSDAPWWRRGLSFRLPWTLRWVSTEILDQDCAQVVHVERAGKRDHESWKLASLAVSATADYVYVLKSGERQERRATFYVDRMTWRAVAWPWIPRLLVRTSISVTFSAGVGERTGSWKGGCIVCSYKMLPGETPIQCLRRMERERKF